MGSHDREQPVVQGILAIITVFLLCAGVGLAVFGVFGRNVPTVALGVAFTLGAVIARPT